MKKIIIPLIIVAATVFSCSTKPCFEKNSKSVSQWKKTMFIHVDSQILHSEDWVIDIEYEERFVKMYCDVNGYSMERLRLLQDSIAFWDSMYGRCKINQSFKLMYSKVPNLCLKEDGKVTEKLYIIYESKSTLITGFEDGIIEVYERISPKRGPKEKIDLVSIIKNFYKTDCEP